jgi:hypothetical protein
MTTDVYETYIRTLKLGLNVNLENKLIKYIEKYGKIQTRIDNENEKKLQLRNRKLLKKQQKEEKKKIEAVKRMEKRMEEIKKKKEMKLLKKQQKPLSPRAKISAIGKIMKNDISLSEVVGTVCKYLDQDISEKISEKYTNIKDRIMDRVYLDEKCDIELVKIEFPPVKVGERYKNKETIRRKNIVYSKTYEVLNYIQSRIYSFICYNNPSSTLKIIENFTIDSGTKINNLNTEEQVYYYSEKLYIPVITPKSNYEYLKNIKCEFNMLYFRNNENVMAYLVNGLYISKYYITVNRETLRKLVKLCKYEIEYEKNKQESDKEICISISNKIESDGIVGNKRYISTNWWVYSENTVKPYLSDLDFIQFNVST